MPAGRLRLCLVGTGVIAAEVRRQLAASSDVQVAAVVRSPRSQEGRAAAPGSGDALAVDAVPDTGIDLVVEMASDAAVTQHVVPALERGIPCLVCSVGALATPDVLASVQAAARKGHTYTQLITGAIGAIDALAAAALGGLSEVRYTGRKPPRAWEGTAAASQHSLAQLQEATVVFAGPARAAALRFPKNANVAATVAIAGIGLDQTHVTLLADPAVDCNVHHVVASGAFGRLEFSTYNAAFADNPRSSMLVAWSVTRAILNHASPIRF
jgi:aspartate dehydrogenase